MVNAKNLHAWVVKNLYRSAAAAATVAAVVVGTDFAVAAGAAGKILDVLQVLGMAPKKLRKWCESHANHISTTGR